MGSYALALALFGFSELVNRADAAAPEGPIAAYSFDEGEGSTVEDLTGNGHTATIEGAAWTTHGRYGGAMEFDGSDDVLKVPDSPELDFSEEFTLEAWVRPGEDRVWAPVLVKEIGDGKSPSEAAYWLYAGQDEQRPYGGTETSEAEEGRATAPESLPVGAWSHLALTYDGNRIRLYVNGELVASCKAPAPRVTEGALEIGGSGELSDFFQGRIDEVRVYGRALGLAELRETVNAGFPIASTDSASEVDANNAILNGIADANGGETDYSFEYGLTESYGRVVTGEALGRNREEIEISEAVIDLAPETTYHYRLVADSPVGTAYGRDRTFTTSERTMTASEEEELAEAESSMTLTASESKASIGSFYGMMWTGDLKKMKNQSLWEAIDRSGAKVVRFAIYPDPDLQAEIDQAFEEAAERDLTILPYFGAGPFPKPGTKNRESWVKYAEAMVKKYGPGSSFSQPVNAWEIWNEPNMPFDTSDPDHEGTANPEGFAVFFREMSEALRSSSKGPIQILTPGLYGFRVPGCHPACHLTPREFLVRMDQQLSKLGSSDAYDAISLHPYVFKIGKPNRQHAPKDAGDVKQVARAVKRVITAVHALRPNKPLWVTELGFPLANPGNKGGVPVVTTAVQKQLVQASFAMMQNNRKRLNLAHAFYYNIQDDSKEGWEYHAGLLTLKGVARPAWTAYSKLAGGKLCPHAPC